jgi:hypothetical protein
MEASTSHLRPAAAESREHLSRVASLVRTKTTTGPSVRRLEQILALCVAEIKEDFAFARSSG